MSVSPPAHPYDPPALAPLRERYLLLTLAGVQFSHILDFMIMMPLGPVLMRDFHVGTHEFGWLVSAYTFTAAASGVCAALFVDRFERKRLLLWVFGLFILATAACGLAPGFYPLLIARALAGAFGGILGAMVQTMVADLIPFARRGRASGTLMSAFSLSTVAGVPLSLVIANQFGWRAPFLFIAALALIFLLLGTRLLPVVTHHLNRPDDTSRHPFSAMAQVLRDPNHWRALWFMTLLMSSGFTVIPFITLYVTANMGIAQQHVPLLYLAGGCATFFSSRAIGRIADSHGKVRIYRRVALFSLLPLFLQTHLGPVPLWGAMMVSVLFFTLVPGRMVPAMAIMASAAQPRLRGTFMSISAAVQQLACGVAAVIGGSIISRDAAGQIVAYGWVGYLAISMTLLAMWFAGRIHLYGTPLATIPNPAKPA